MNLGELLSEEQLRKNLGRVHASSEVGIAMDETYYMGANGEKICGDRETPAQFGLRRPKMRKRPISKPASELDTLLTLEKETTTALKKELPRQNTTEKRLTEGNFLKNAKKKKGEKKSRNALGVGGSSNLQIKTTESAMTTPSATATRRF